MSFKLVSVNTSPERAARVINAVIQNVKNKYDIVHVGNTTTIEGVKPLLLSARPDLMFCASMWTPEQQEEAQKIARETIPTIKTFAIPTGLHVKAGPEGVIQYITERVDSIIGQ